MAEYSDGKVIEKEWENSVRARRAMELFRQGYNCAQSVFLAFEDYYEIDRSTALKLSSSFGGGMGRLREVCGAVSGMFLTVGMLMGYDAPDDYKAKKEHYERIQYLAGQFKAVNGSIVCRELLERQAQAQKTDKNIPIAVTTDPSPELRTPEYYKKRPCPELVGIAAAIVEEYLAEQ